MATLHLSSILAVLTLYQSPYPYTYILRLIYVDCPFVQVVGKQFQEFTWMIHE